MNGTLRVMTFSCSEAVLAGIESALAGELGNEPSLIKIIASVRRYEQVARKVRELAPDVVVLHGITRERVSDWCHEGRPAAVLAVERDWSGADTLYALREGIVGVISPDTDLASLARVCQDVAAGSAYLSPLLLCGLVQHISGAGDASAQTKFGLTARELQALRYLSAGRSLAEISALMGIASRTVKHHLGNIYRKLNVRDRTQAIVLAYREGLAS